MASVWDACSEVSYIRKYLPRYSRQHGDNNLTRYLYRHGQEPTASLATGSKVFTLLKQTIDRPLVQVNFGRRVTASVGLISSMEVSTICQQAFSAGRLRPTRSDLYYV